MYRVSWPLPCPGSWSILWPVSCSESAPDVLILTLDLPCHDMMTLDLPYGHSWSTMRRLSASLGALMDCQGMSTLSPVVDQEPLHDVGSASLDTLRESMGTRQWKRRSGAERKTSQNTTGWRKQTSQNTTTLSSLSGDFGAVSPSEGPRPRLLNPKQADQEPLQGQNRADQDSAWKRYS